LGRTAKVGGQRRFGRAAEVREGSEGEAGRGLGISGVEGERVGGRATQINRT
jgi:hypothetical protein